MQNQSQFPHYGPGSVPLPSQTSPGNRLSQETLPHLGQLYCPPGTPLGYAPGVDLMSPTQRLSVLPPSGQQMNYLHTSPLMYGNYEQFLHQQHSAVPALASPPNHMTSGHMTMPPMFSPDSSFTSSGAYNYTDGRIPVSHASNGGTSGALPSFQSLKNADSLPSRHPPSAQSLVYGSIGTLYNGFPTSNFSPTSVHGVPTSLNTTTGTLSSLGQLLTTSSDNFKKAQITSALSVETYSSMHSPILSSSVTSPHGNTISSQKKPLSNTCASASSEGSNTRMQAIFTCQSQQENQIKTLSSASVASIDQKSQYSSASSTRESIPLQHLPMSACNTVTSNHQHISLANDSNLAAVTADVDERVTPFEKALLNFQHMELSAVTEQALARYGIEEEPQLVGDKFFCQKCNYYTTRVDKVLQHLKAHRGNITCEICGKAFLKRADKVRHMTCHTTPTIRGPRVMKINTHFPPQMDVNNLAVPPSSMEKEHHFSSPYYHHQDLLSDNNESTESPRNTQSSIQSHGEREPEGVHGMVSSLGSENQILGMKIVNVESLSVPSMWDDVDVSSQCYSSSNNTSNMNNHSVGNISNALHDDENVYDIASASVVSFINTSNTATTAPTSAWYKTSAQITQTTQGSILPRNDGIDVVNKQNTGRVSACAANGLAFATSSIGINSSTATSYHNIKGMSSSELHGSPFTQSTACKALTLTSSVYSTGNMIISSAPLASMSRSSINNDGGITSSTGIKSVWCTACTTIPQCTSLLFSSTNTTLTYSTVCMNRSALISTMDQGRDSVYSESHHNTGAEIMGKGHSQKKHDRTNTPGQMRSSSQVADGVTTEQSFANSTAIFKFKRAEPSEKSSESEDNNNGESRHHNTVKLTVGDEEGECNEIILLDESIEDNFGESLAIVKKETMTDDEYEEHESRVSDDGDEDSRADASDGRQGSDERGDFSLNDDGTIGRPEGAVAEHNIDETSHLNETMGRLQDNEQNSGGTVEEDEQLSENDNTTEMPTLPDAIESVSALSSSSTLSQPEVKQYKTPIFQFNRLKANRKPSILEESEQNSDLSELQKSIQAAMSVRGEEEAPAFNINSLRCVYCSYTGSSPRHLAKHYKAHATSYKICRFCNKAFERPSDLVRHEQRHIRNQTIFGSDDLRSTRTGHDGSEVKALFMKPPITNKRNVLHCRRCGFATTDQHMLNRHLAKSHKQQIFSCEFCTHKFLSETTLYNHIIDCHSAPDADVTETTKMKKTLKYWTCSICEKTCITRKELATHFSTEHRTSEYRKGKNKNIDFTAERAAWQNMQVRRIEYSPYVYQPPGVYQTMPEHWSEPNMPMKQPYGQEERTDSFDAGEYEDNAEEDGISHEDSNLQGTSENEVHTNENGMVQQSNLGRKDARNMFVSMDNFSGEVCEKESDYLNLIEKIRKQVENQMQHEKSKDTGIEDCIVCPVCGKIFDSFPVCNIHQLVSHSMCSIRVDKYRNNILTATNLMKADVVGDNEVSLYVDPVEKFADASGFKEVPTVSSIKDAKLLCTQIKRAKHLSLTLEDKKSTTVSSDIPETEKPTAENIHSEEAAKEVEEEIEEPSNNNESNNESTTGNPESPKESSGKVPSYFFNITPDSHSSSPTPHVVSLSQKKNSEPRTVSMVSILNSAIPSVPLHQTSLSMPRVIEPQTISAIAAEVKKINAQMKVSQETPNKTPESSVDGVTLKQAPLSSVQSSSSSSFGKKFSVSSSTAKLDSLDPDIIVENVLKKYSKETDSQDRHRTMSKHSPALSKSPHVVHTDLTKGNMAPHIQDHSYFTSGLYRNAMRQYTVDKKRKLKDTMYLQETFPNKRKTIGRTTMAEENPMIMPTIASVMSLSSEANIVPQLNSPISTSTAIGNPLPVLNSITDIGMCNQITDDGVLAQTSQPAQLKIVGNPIRNANTMHHNTFSNQSELDWTTERSSAMSRTKCKPGPSKFATYKCPKCSYGTNALHKYKQHEQAHEHAKYICKVCDKACIKSCDLVRHWVAHNIKTDNGEWRCDSCEFSDYDKEVLERHMLCHYYINKKPPWELNNSDPSTFEMKIEGKRWLSQRPHRNNRKPKKKVSMDYGEPLQNATETKIGSMEGNITTIPKQLSPVKEMCTECNKLVPRLLMSHHRREEHSKGKGSSHVRTRHKSKYYCPKCGLGFTDVDAMFVHSFNEHDSNDFEPTQGINPDGNDSQYNGNEGLPSQVTLDYLGDIQNQMPEGVDNIDSNKDQVKFTCLRCEKSFPSQYYLGKHCQNEHWETDLEEKKKEEQEQGDYHMPAAPVVKEITCPICSKILTKSYLKLHMRLHTGEKPYKCTKCTASFAIAQYLQQHLRSKHKRKAKRLKRNRHLKSSKTSKKIGLNLPMKTILDDPTKTSEPPLLSSGPATDLTVDAGSSAQIGETKKADTDVDTSATEEADFTED